MVASMLSYNPMETASAKNDPKYNEMISFFGSPSAMAAHFAVKIQAIYQWKEKVPETRIREYELVKQMQQNNNSAA